MLVPPTLPPLAIDPASLLAPLGIAVLTVTLLRRYRLRTSPARSRRAKQTATDPATAVREAARESAGAWELRLHDAGRAAEASLSTKAAELNALAARAEGAAERLRLVAPPTADDAPVTLPIGEERVRLHLRQAGYDDRQIDVILSRDGDGERERAA